MEPTGVISLEGCTVRPLIDVGVDFCFEIASKNLNYFLKADNIMSMNEWLSCINSASAVIKNTTSTSSAGDDDSSASAESRFSEPTKVGWLQKQGGSNAQYQRRWCVLKGLCLFYFKEQAVRWASRHF